MTTGETRARRDGIRECDCPAYVVRCVHDGPVMLHLLSNALYTKHPDWCWAPVIGTDAGWKVWSMVNGKPEDCWCGLERSAWSADGPPSLLYEGDNESDALAAFYEAEARLLAGDGTGIAAPR